MPLLSDPLNEFKWPKASTTTYPPVEILIIPQCIAAAIKHDLNV